MRTTSSMMVVIALLVALMFVLAASMFAAIITEAQAVKGEAGRNISFEEEGGGGERHQSLEGARYSGVGDNCGDCG
jgi:hypothetical protein